MEAVTLKAVLLFILLSAVLESQAARDCDGKGSIRIGRKRYCSQVIIRDDAHQTIVIDKNDNVYYINNEKDIKVLAPNQNKSTTLIGTPSKMVTDLLADGEDILISTNWINFHKYSTVTKSTRPFTFFPWRVRRIRTFLQQINESRSSRLGARMKNEMHRISESSVKLIDHFAKALVFTFDTRSGDFYYCPVVQYHGNLALIRANKLWTTKIYIQGLPTGSVKTHKMTYDRINNVVYFCRMDGLYYLQPPSVVVHRVKGLSTINALGLDGKGGLYLGLEGQILKLLPVTRSIAAPMIKVPNRFGSGEEYSNKQLLETFFAKINTFFNNH